MGTKEWKKKNDMDGQDPMFADDSRFKQGKKEVLIGVGLVIFNFLWWSGFAYGLGSARPEEYQYILGFPAWFFYSSIGSLVIMSILVVFFVKKYFVEVPFDDESNEEK